MREILFRGKTFYKKEWIEGYYIYNPSGPMVHGIAAKDSPYDWYEIDPETLGQYTGLQDGNGVKIFEGDIIRYSSSECDLPHWMSYHKNYVVGYSNGYAGFRPLCEYDSDCDISVSSKDFVIIGNIYDNPDLIEEKEIHNRVGLKWDVSAFFCSTDRKGEN